MRHASSLKRFERGLFVELMPALVASHEIMGLSDGHDDPKVETHAVRFTGEAGNLFQPGRHIGLGSEVEVHIGVNGEGISARCADPFPLSVGLHSTLIDAEGVALAHRAANCCEPPFHLLDGHGPHRHDSESIISRRAPATRGAEYTGISDSSAMRPGRPVQRTLSRVPEQGEVGSFIFEEKPGPLEVR